MRSWRWARGCTGNKLAGSASEAQPASEGVRSSLQQVARRSHLRSRYYQSESHRLD